MIRAYQPGRLVLALALVTGCGRLGYDGLGEDGPDAGPPPLALIAAGGCHTCSLRGVALACWGCNDDGQLGTGDRNDRPRPARIEPLSSAHTLAVGRAHSCALKGGSLFCWGDNAAGQLGNGSPDDAVDPARIGGSTAWGRVVAGAAHSCAIDSAGALSCWGENGDGQLGLGSPSLPQREPTEVAGGGVWRQGSAGGRSSCFLQADRSLWCWGLPLFAAGPLQVDRAPHDDVSVGGDSICAIRSHDGRLQCTCGGADCSELDWQTIPSAVGWARVAAGDAHRCAIDRAGALWCWGDNSGGQLGVGDTDDRAEPTRVGQESDWSDVVAGSRHTCGVRQDGGTWCWGANGRGELGQGSAGEASPVPLPVSF